MAKNRNKKRSNGASMDVEENTAVSSPQAMDTSETGAAKKGSSNGTILSTSVKVKGRQMKRTKNIRKLKAKAKAISQSEKIEEKVTKNETKSVRTQSAKTLYE